MSEPFVRALVVLGVVGLAVAVGVLSSRLRRPHHPAVDIAGLGSAPGVVIFTSTDCASCKEALEIVRAQPLPVREVTNELEPGRLEAAGVEAVPLTIVVAADGAQLASFAGVPPQRGLRRAVERASG